MIVIENVYGDTDQEHWGPHKGQWLINTFGKPGEPNEVALVREDYKHGFRSWGWDGESKIIFKTTIRTQEQWNKILEGVQAMAEVLNR